jgi:methylmalonyl-CoA mutase
MDQILSKKLNLRDEFAPADYQTWKAVVDSDLKGIPFDKKLKTYTYEGITLNPLYTKEDLENFAHLNQFPGSDNCLRSSFVSGNSIKPWLIAQSLSNPFSEDYNKLLIDALKKGQTAVVLNLDKTTKLGLDADYGKLGDTGLGGVSISGIGSLSRAFTNIDLTKYPLFVNSGFSPLYFLTLLKGYSSQASVDFSKMTGAVYGDPISFLFDNGEIPISIEEAYKQIKKSIEYLNAKISNLRTVGIDGSIYAEKGASSVQELAISMALAVEAMVRLSDMGLDPKAIAEKMIFNFGISTNLFMEIAKFRASRILFSEVLKHFEITIDEVQMFSSAKTSSYYHSFIDPYVNMLRVTTQAFSAVMGEVQMIETLTFDSTFAQSDEFSNRIARNTQIILSEESHLNSVIDSAGGSFYVETLTQELAEKAWKYFKEIEQFGGIYEAVKQGKIQNDISQVVEKRLKDVATRKSIIVGVNNYANTKEEIFAPKVFDIEKVHKVRAEYLQKLRLSGNGRLHGDILVELESIKHEKDTIIQIDTASELVLKGATIGEISSHLQYSSDCEKTQLLLTKRPAELFERLRLRASNAKLKTGSLPKVYLFNIGPVKQYKARADFSRGFLEAGGFDVIYRDGVKSISEGIDEADNSCAKVFVLCSTDETYPELVPQFVNEIKSLNKDFICILAGYPKDQIEDHKKSGIDDFIFLGADVVKVISDIFDKTGVN